MKDRFDSYLSNKPAHLYTLQLQFNRIHTIYHLKCVSFYKKIYISGISTKMPQNYNNGHIALKS